MINTTYHCVLLLLTAGQVSNAQHLINKTKNSNQLLSAPSKLCSQVSLKWAKIVSIAEVKLFATGCSDFTAAKNSDNKSLEFTFKRKISANFFKKAANESFKDNLTLKGQSRSVTLQINESFNNHYQSVFSGDIYVIHHDASKGVFLYKNAQLLASSDDELFAKHYLNIWLGEKPAIENLKKLLEKSFN